VRETRPGDRYLLCSDGLSGVVSEETIRDTLAEEASTDVAVERLVELALKGGGPDNITAIVADVVEVETKPPSAVPVTVGAAAEGVVQRSRDDTPAGKAAALRPPPEDTSQDQDAEPEPRRRRGGPVLIVLVLLLLLAVAGGYGAYRWSQTQYYVGAEGSSVAIFRGLTQDVGPVATSELYSDEDIPLTDLPPYQQERVLADIPTAGLTDARRIVATLRKQAELCREQAAAAASPSPTATPTASASADGTSASPAPSPTPSPTGTTSDGGASAADCGDGS
jgi:PPM family protein phosphatase